MYAFFTATVVRESKPTLEAGINGAWLLGVVATQSVSVLGTLLAPGIEDGREVVLFVALCLYLLGALDRRDLCEARDSSQANSRCMRIWAARCAASSVALLLADLGVTKTHSRPHVSNDNPFSEAQFRTLKYCPQFPDRFGSIEDGRAFCHSFFSGHNDEHHHSGLGFLEPAVVHFGQAAAVRAHRSVVLTAAYAAHPERFVNGRPRPADLPTAVCINPPVKNPARQDAPGTTIALSNDQRVARIQGQDEDVGLVMIDRNATLIPEALVSQCH